MPTWIRQDGEWVDIQTGASRTAAPERLGFTAEQTHSDTSWLATADEADTLNVERVTNLNASGTGSLDAAINNAASYPTVVVFEVGGVIDLAGGQVAVNNGPVWIAGETAPDPGISIIKGRTRSYAQHVIWSHVGFYRGDDTGGAGTEGDTVVMDNSDQVYDHCSMFWGTDGTCDMTNPHARCSVINCIVAETLHMSIHPDGAHSRGMLINDAASTDICVYGTLFANHNRRHPLCRGDIVMVNNYIYNGGWDGELIHFNDIDQKDAISQSMYVEDGPNSQTTNPIHLYYADLYYDDIQQSGSHPIVDNNITVVSSPANKPAGLDLDADPVAGSEVPTFVSGMAGMRPANRPSVDQNFIDNRVGGANGVQVDSQTEVGGYPAYAQTTRTLDVPSTGVVDWIRENHTAAVEHGT